MKSRIIALALIVLFLFPLTLAPIDGQYSISEPVRTNEGASDYDVDQDVNTATEYYDSMESVEYWDSFAEDWDTWETSLGNLHCRYDSTAPNKYPLRNMDNNDGDDPNPRPAVTAYDNATYTWYLYFKVDYSDTADYFRLGFREYHSGGDVEWFNFDTYSKNVWHFVEYDPQVDIDGIRRIEIMAQLDNGEYAELWLAWVVLSPSASPFSETLDDDVLYYPDYDMDQDVNTATEYYDSMESVQYWDPAAEDWDTWETSLGNLHCRYDSTDANQYPLRNMDNNDGDDPNPRPDVTGYDYATYTWYLHFKVNYSDTADYFRLGFRETNAGGDVEWFNFDTYSKNVWHFVEYDPQVDIDGIRRIDIMAQLDDGEYAELWLAWVALIPTENMMDHVWDGSQYREGFGAVGDFDEYLQDGGDTYSTDDDVLTIEAGGDSYALITDDISLNWDDFDYLEVYRKFNVSGFGGHGRLEVWSQDGRTGDTAYFKMIDVNTDWVTDKFHKSDIIGGTALSVIESIGFRMYITDSTQVSFSADYLRVGPADEMGWQHDGSTTEGTENEGSAGWVFENSSDGDVLQFDWTRTGGVDTAAWQQINIDPTTTSAEIELDYYPMWELRWRVTEATNASFSALQIYTDDTRLAINAITSTDETTSWATMRYNMKASTDTGIGGNSIRFYVGNSQDTATFTLKINWTKFYSITNYTISQSSTTVDDYLYVSEGILYSNMTSGTITLDYDPNDLNFVGLHSWSKSTSYGTTGLSFYRGSWSSYFNATEGDLMGGNVTDIRIRFSEDANVINILLYKTQPTWHSFAVELIYFDMPNWHIFTFEDIIFYIPIGVLTLSYIMALAGLVMIPVSTIFLVKGGRSEMSNEKLFLFLMIFLLGWAFFLGGIL